MIFHTFGTPEQQLALENMLSEAILAFEIPSDQVVIKNNTDKNLFGLAALPALVFEEPTLQFQEVLFEGQMPQREELDMLFTGLFGLACSG